MTDRGIERPAGGEAVSASGSAAKAALEAAAEALAQAEGFTPESIGRHDLEDFTSYSAAVIEAWLSSLLGELPEEAVEALAKDRARRRQKKLNAAGHWEGRLEPLDPELAWTDEGSSEEWREEQREKAVRRIHRVLRSLRGSLNTGGGV